MALPLSELGARALAALSADDLGRSAVYLDPRVHAAGATIQVDRRSSAVERPTVVAFVDLEPGANWGHACRYMLIDAEQGDVRTIDAQFPPDRAALRLLHRGSGVEDWMLLSSEPLS